jgi:hypothetical protein
MPRLKLNGDETTSTDLTRPHASSFDSITKGIQSALSCCKRKEAVETDTSQTNNYGSFLPLAFALRRFVVDLDTQFIAIFHLEHNPGFSHGSAKIFISSEGNCAAKGTHTRHPCPVCLQASRCSSRNHPTPSKPI